MSERHWAPLDLEAGSIFWSIKRLVEYLWGTTFRFFRATRRSKALPRLLSTTPSPEMARIPQGIPLCSGVPQK